MLKALFTINSNLLQTSSSSLCCIFWSILLLTTSGQLLYTRTIALPPHPEILNSFRFVLILWCLWFCRKLKCFFNNQNFWGNGPNYVPFQKSITKKLRFRVQSEKRHSNNVANYWREKETTDISTNVNWFLKHDHLANQTTIIRHHYDFWIITRD